MNILIFAEDPGAANCFRGVPAALRSRGFSVTIAAAALAKKYFEAQGETYVLCESRQDLEGILGTSSPSVVLVGTAENPESVGLYLIEAAKRRGCFSLSVVDAAMNVERRFSGTSGDPLRFAPDLVAVVDEWTRKKFHSLGFSAVEVIGHPQFDFLMKKKQELDRVGVEEIRKKVFPMGPKGKVVVFVSEGSARVVPARLPKGPDYLFSGTSGSQDRMEIMIEEFLLAIQGLDIFPVLRVHPKDDLADYSRFASQFAFISQNEAPLDFVFASDVVVGCTSMLLTESFLLGVPTLCTPPRLSEKDWLPGARVGLIPCVTSREAYREQIESLLLEGRAREPALGGEHFPLGAVEKLCGLIEARAQSGLL